MRADFYPLQILLFTISGWVNRRQQDMIAYLVEENRVLKEQSKGRKPRWAGRADGCSYRKLIRSMNSCLFCSFWQHSSIPARLLILSSTLV